MDLTDADLHGIELDLDNLRKPTITQLRAMVTEIRASRTELRTLLDFVRDVNALHQKLGEAIQRTGEVR